MWKDIDIQLRKKVNGDIKDMTNIYAIENSIENIFKTMPGSRRMLPPFASPIYGLLFEPIDKITAERIGYLLLESIEKWETRIQIENINVDPREDDNMYIITLKYNIINDGTKSFNIFKTILRAV